MTTTFPSVPSALKPVMFRVYTQCFLICRWRDVIYRWEVKGEGVQEKLHLICISKEIDFFYELVSNCFYFHFIDFKILCDIYSVRPKVKRNCKEYFYCRHLKNWVRVYCKQLVFQGRLPTVLLVLLLFIEIYSSTPPPSMILFTTMLAGTKQVLCSVLVQWAGVHHFFVTVDIEVIIFCRLWIYWIVNCEGKGAKTSQVICGYPLNGIFLW